MKAVLNEAQRCPLNGRTPNTGCRGSIPAGAALSAWLVLAAGAAAAQEAPVDLELVLAVDVSRSMDLDELRLQREGYVRAFRNPLVANAIRYGGTGRIAVTYVEWAGPGEHRIIAPWTGIANAVDAEDFAELLAGDPIGNMRGTSISGAIAFGARLFNGNGFHGRRRLIDVSGDGPNKDGVPVLAARQAALERGIVINGLPIQLTAPDLSGPFEIVPLDIYYQDCVIGGFGAFIVPVNHPSQFATAIRRKLILEIAGPPPRLVPAQSKPAEPRIDCLIGEKLWRQWRQWDDDDWSPP